MWTVAIYYLLAIAVIAGVVAMALVPAGSTSRMLWFAVVMLFMGGLFVVAGFDVRSPRLAWIPIIVGMLFVLLAVYELSL